MKDLPRQWLLFPGLQFFKAISEKDLGLYLRVVEFVTLGKKKDKLITY